MPSREVWTVAHLLQWTTEHLKRHGADTPRLDAEVLLAAALGCQRIDLYTAFGSVPAEEARAAFREMVRRRAAGTPVAYLVGYREFYSLNFRVTPDVLIPRPETEFLLIALLDLAKTVSQAGTEGPETPEGEADICGTQLVQAGDCQVSPLLPAEKENLSRPPCAPADAEVSSGFSVPATGGAVPGKGPGPGVRRPLAICDVGTGSGVLAVCAAKHLPSARVTAVDISPAALAVARSNAAAHGVLERIEFFESNLLASVPHGRQFDFILANLPYVTEAEFAALSPTVKEHEPRQALLAGPRGTELIEALLPQAAERLHAGGYLLMEISPGLHEAVQALLAANGQFKPGSTVKDLSRHPRVVQAQKK